jgi:hypothetical protein
MTLQPAEKPNRQKHEVSGHDFSRANKGYEMAWALAPEGRFSEPTDKAKLHPIQPDLIDPRHPLALRLIRHPV